MCEGFKSLTYRLRIVTRPLMMQKWAVFLVKTTHFYSAKQLPCIEHIVICLWADIADHIKTADYDIRSAAQRQ